MGLYHLLNPIQSSPSNHSVARLTLHTMTEVEKELQTLDPPSEVEEQEDTKDTMVVDVQSSTGKDVNNKKEKKQQRNEIIQFIQSEIREQAIPLVFGTLAMVGSTLANQALPKLLGKLLDDKTTTTISSNPSSSSSKTLMFVALGGGLASFARTVLLNRAQEGIAARLRCKIIASLLIHHDLQFFSSRHLNMNTSTSSSSSSKEIAKAVAVQSHTNATAQGTSSPSSSHTTLSSPANILSILQTDVASVSSACTTNLANIFRSICSTSFSTYHLISLHPPLRLQVSLLSLIPLLGISAISMHKRIKKLTMQQISLQDTASTFAEERISNISTVHIHNRQVLDTYMYQTLQDKIVTIGKRISFQKGIFMGFLFASGSTALASIFALGGTIVSQGFMTHGDLTRYDSTGSFPYDHLL